MMPTPKAEQLSAPIRALLHGLEANILGAQGFDPRTLRKTFAIHTTDLIECLLMPNLLRSLESEAPHLKVVSRPAGFSLPRDEMERGTCDVAIAGFFGDLPDGFYQQKLFTDQFQTAFRQNHPRLKGKKSLTLDEYCSERHVLIAPGGDLRGRVDDLLKKKKRERQIVAGLNVFMSSAWIISQSDYLLTGPSRLLAQIGQAFPIQVMAVPLEIPGITIVQAWHERNHQDPGLKWLRERIRKILQE
jgi:DNA-binding transcriptional LysR family regulator